MKRLFLMLVLTFTTVTFFANEKMEVLPVENNVETPDFSMEDEYRQIRRQERQERRRIRRERRALRRSPEGKILRGHLARFFGFTSLALAVPYTVASIGYTYHVVPLWWQMIVNDATSVSLNAILLPFTFLGRFSAIWLMWIRPSTPGRISAKAPKVISFTTLASTTSPMA